MSKFKKGQKVLVVNEKDNFKTTGEIIDIRKGTYDKSTGNYTLDIYVVRDDVNKSEVYCSKSNLHKMDYENETNDKNEKKNKKESVFQATVQLDGRLITVVGVRNIENVTKKYSRKISSKIGKKDVNGFGLFLKNVRVKSLSIGHAICMPEDEYDEKIGVNLAYRRAMDKKKLISTNSWSMLSDDQCRAIIQNEAEYIADNIQKYVSK